MMCANWKAQLGQRGTYEGGTSHTFPTAQSEAAESMGVTAPRSLGPVVYLSLSMPGVSMVTRAMRDMRCM